MKIRNNILIIFDNDKKNKKKPVVYLLWFRLIIENILFNETLFQFVLAAHKYIQGKKNIFFKIARYILRIYLNYSENIICLSQKRIKKFHYKDPIYFLKDNANPLMELQYKQVWKPFYLGRKFEFSNLNIRENAVFRFSLVFLENSPHEIIGSTLLIDINVLDNSNNTISEQTFHLPVNITKKQNAVKHFIGRGIIYIEAELPKCEKATVIMNTTFKRNNDDSCLEKRDKEYFLGIGIPSLLHKKSQNETKRTLILSIESLTNQSVLQKRFKKIKNTCFYDKLNELPDFINLDHAYSQGDHTLPAISSFFTGLAPSRTGLNIKAPPKVFRLSSEIPTIAEIAKQNNFITYAQIGSGMLGESGFARGFDHYEIVQQNNIHTLIDFFDDNKHFDSYAFVHLAYLHVPFAMPKTINDDLRFHPHEEFESRELAYNQGFYDLETALTILISSLKAKGFYDNTTIVLTGDHGCGLYPWGDHGKNALYEERINVPFALKMAKHLNSKNVVSNINNGAPFNATASAYHIVHSCVTKKGVMQNICPMQCYDDVIGAYALSETIHRPSKEYYAVALISKKYKYQLFAKVDWDNSQLSDVYNQMFFVRDTEGFFDEKNNVINDYGNTVQGFNEVALKHLKESLTFRTRFPSYCFN